MRSTWDLRDRRAAHGAFERDDDRGLTALEHSEAAMRRELAWTLAGCSAVVLAANLLCALFTAG